MKMEMTDNAELAKAVIRGLVQERDGWRTACLSLSAQLYAAKHPQMNGNPEPLKMLYMQCVPPPPGSPLRPE